MKESEDNLNKILARNLKQVRMKMGISQLQLANLCEISQSFIGEIEAGRKYPSLKTLELIAHHLQIKPYMLLFEESDKLGFDKEYLLDAIKTELKEKLPQGIDSIIDTFT